MVEENQEIPDLTGETQPVDTEQAADTNGRKASRFAIVAIIIAALMLGGIYIYLRRMPLDTDDEKGKKQDTVVSVKVARVETGSIGREFTAVGTVAPSGQSTVSASISAQIRQMRLLKNAVVQKGEILAVLASQDLAAQRAEAQAAVQEARLNLQTLQNVTIPQASAQSEKDLSDAKAAADNARVIYERRKDLFAKGGISQKEVEASQLAMTNAENTLRLVRRSSKLNTSAANPNARSIIQNKIAQAESRLKVIQTQAGYAEIRAPISGIVTDQFQFEGEFASQGAKLFTIADITSVIVKASFADTVAQSLKNGDLVTVSAAAAPDEKLTGSVTLISRSADTLSRTVEVWANFGNGRGLLRAGDAVQFTVAERPAEGAVIVPAAAVQLNAANGDEGTVMIVDALNIAHETKVKIGVRSGGKYQITEGLKGGENIVIEGNYALPDGTHVEIAPEAEKVKGKE